MSAAGCSSAELGASAYASAREAAESVLGSSAARQRARCTARWRGGRTRGHHGRELRALPPRAGHGPRQRPAIAENHGPARQPDVLLAREGRASAQHVRGDAGRPAVLHAGIRLWRTCRSATTALDASLLPLQPPGRAVRVPRAGVLLRRHTHSRFHRWDGPGSDARNQRKARAVVDRTRRSPSDRPFCSSATVA